MKSLMYFACCIVATTLASPTDQVQVDVIVVGAGASGIAASSRLYENGFEVIVLEAGNRIGGRVNSQFFGDAYVDLGAEWCHGEGDNLVYEMIKPYNVLKHSYYQYKLYFSDHRNIGSDFNDELFELFDETYSSDGDRNQPPDISVGEYFIKRYNESVREKWGNNPEKFRIAMMCLETWSHFALSDEGAFSWYDSSATNDYRIYEGDLEQNWAGRGYKTILELMLKKFPRVDPNYRLDRRILFNKEVIEIRYGQDRVTALCRDGSRYIGSHLIFTPSLGFLKHNYRTLFKPRLGAEKEYAIKTIGIAGVHKVMARFDDIWWSLKNFTGFSLVWTYEDKEMLPVEYPYGPIDSDRSWLNEAMAIYRTEKNPNVLSFWFDGLMTSDIEMMPDNDVMDGIYFLCVKFFGHMYNISKPAEIKREKWYNNKFFRGTYSYQTEESRKFLNPSSNDILAEPILNYEDIPRLQFAGEATSHHHYSTVHGAIESGYREADRLIELYLK